MKDQLSAILKSGTDDALYIIDVSSFIFRAYYSVGYLSTSDGIPTGAVFGVANMLISLFKECEPHNVAIAMDSKTPTFRKEIYPEYKANRPPPPDDLKVQFPFVGELVDSFGLAVLQRDGFEADDVIATAVKKAREAGRATVIVSADKDLMQLVDDNTVMLDTMKKKVWDSAAVEEKWGVSPALLGDLLALAGDSSDNIPGVPRVGPKTAAPLLNEHGGLEPLLANLEKLKSKAMQKRLAEHTEDARISRKLVALKDDVPLEFTLEQTIYSSPDPSVLGPVLDKYEFTQLKHRLFGEQASEAAAPDVSYETISDVKALTSFVKQIKKVGRFAVDLETTSIDAVVAQIVGMALSVAPHTGVYVPIAHRQGTCVPLEDVLSLIGPLLEDPSIGVIVQNVKYEDTIFRRNGIVMTNIEMDPMLASYLLRSEARSHSLDALASDILKRSTKSYDDVTEKVRGSQLLFDEVSVDNATEYAAEDAEVAFCLADAMTPTIKNAQMDKLLHDVEIPLARVLCKMELEGVSVDVDHLAAMSKAFGTQIDQLETQAYEVAGRKFNLASPKQLQEILFTELGLPTQKKTKTGFSTDSEVLQTLSFMHELPSLLLEHRNLTKLKNTYLDALPKLVNSQTRRIHTSYNQAIAATGRLSSSNPNLQNIPIRTDRGRDIRRAFIARPGCVLLSADYSQIELRILAHLSQDPALMSAYVNGDDIHVRTARAVFGLEEGQEVNPEQRAAAKAVNFGVIYGKTGFSLAKELGISRAEGQQFIDAYFDLYQGVASYMEKIIETSRQEKGASTLLGRKRILRDIDSRNFNVRQHAERMARNMPIQGTAADLLKVAMINVDRALEKENLQAKMILTVHDELVLEVPEEELAQVQQVVKREMEGAMALDVPLVVDMGVGENWAEAH